MRFPSISTKYRRDNARGHSANALALSIAAYICIGTPRIVEGAFVTSDTRRLPSSSFVQKSLPRFMATDDNESENDLPISGSFFNQVPPPKEPSSDEGGDDVIENISLESESITSDFGGNDMEMFGQIIAKTQVRRTPEGFSKTTSTTDHVTPSVIQTTDEKKSFVGIGKPLNDVSNPEYDENGYTLYADETTGEKKRVFEALVEYPSVFKMKIVGKDDENESFAPEIVDVVAKSCGVENSMVKHTSRKNGKWTSVTVDAPVKNADMLYSLYANVDKDPRVKFKF